ncbi:unnamed protein product [Mycena citricolor]|uniref:Survival protein SurE-like phosphatase/nucleotidase domain-containing protein n=1 Tax=Mycena citricolor TaxID=2018698 RepID=A0AAD2Q6Z8_9AGAR|nr:unnamed protein product [Mycena citricolor]
MAFRTLVLAALVSLALAAPSTKTKIVLTNDDGWAVANIRAQYDALTTAGYDVILSAPSINRSGTGSSSKTPTPLTSPCEFDSCPTGSPAEGSDPTNPRLNYVNSYPVDAVTYGITNLSQSLFSGPPDFVVSGPNVGYNLGIQVPFSGTVGAASAAVRAGIPAVAFSASTGSEISYTTLTSDPTSADSQAALIYSQVTTQFVNALISTGKPYLPTGLSLNVNYPPISSSGCASAADFKFVLSRVDWNPFATDVNTCGSTHLPTESTVTGTSGCFASVSVFDATNGLKLDGNASEQAAILQKLGSILTCLP